MDDTGLLNMLLERVGSSNLSDLAGLLVLAAYEGDDELEQALAGAVRGERPTLPAVQETRVPRTYLKTIEASGFRGIGPTSALRLQAGPGLTLIAGRNGSGKSSFAEAAEVALTGTNARWAGRVNVWKEGWRNLHCGDVSPSVSVELVVDGKPGVTKVAREWKGDDVDAATGWAQHTGSPRQPVDRLGLDEPLSAFRPFLSYSELGAMLLGKPSELHDALFSILGLEAVASAGQRLKGAHRALEDTAKAVTQTQRALLTRTTQLDDERARKVAAALTGRIPNLAAIELVLRTEPAVDDDLGQLRTWAGLSVPDTGAAADAASALEQADALARDVAGTESEQARQLVRLLGAALAHAKHSSSEDCPVCGATARLDDAWRTGTEAEIERLRSQAAAADQAQVQLAAAWSAAAAAAVNPPVLPPKGPPGIDSDALLALWREWGDAARSRDTGTAATALRDTTASVVAAIEEAVAAARAEIERREDVWAPIQHEVAAFLLQAGEVQRAASLKADLKAAMDWLREQAESLRNDRLAPLAASAARIWEMLRQQSNVELGPVRLEGAATRRRVVLDVTVDGIEGAALGVMSQGELHALALSLFLPRAMLAESPFQFLVIDDPVQAMDPSKVDGLARVLAEVAATHQVVVFTHDDRLPEALRRLQLPATVWEVARRERSVVELKKSTDPVDRYLHDARSLAKTPELPASVSGRVVAGLCRGAIEAASHEAIRRRRLARGDRHADVEGAISSAHTTNQLVALALFDDETRGGDVLTRLNTFGRWAADAYNACRKGVHAGHTGDLMSLVSDTSKLADKLRA